MKHENDHPPIGDLIPDEDTLEVYSAIATVLARGDEPTRENVREAIRAQRKWERSLGLEPRAFPFRG